MGFSGGYRWIKSRKKYKGAQSYHCSTNPNVFAKSFPPSISLSQGSQQQNNCRRYEVSN